jgi:hypothetical protein
MGAIAKVFFGVSESDCDAPRMLQSNHDLSCPALTSLQDAKGFEKR